MSSEERKKILQMVEEGTISVEEAASPASVFVLIDVLQQSLRRMRLLAGWFQPASTRWHRETFRLAPGYARQALWENCPRRRADA